MVSSQPLNIICKTGEALQTALKHRDEYTQNHCERVSKIASQAGKHFGFDDKSLSQLQIAAVFHDIGKIGIPDSILLNPGSLSDDEFEQMKAHAMIGANIVEKLDIQDAGKIAETILYHHEHYDGSGYPHGLKGEEIPLSSRIITVIDVFDALSTKRRYREPSNIEKTLSVMSNEMIHQFDRDVFDVVSHVIRNTLPLELDSSEKKL